MVAADALEQRLDLRVVAVVAAERDAGAAAHRHLLGGVLNRPRPAERRRLAANTPSGDVDGRSLLAQDERDPFPAAAARASDESDPILQPLHDVRLGQLSASRDFAEGHGWDSPPD